MKLYNQYRYTCLNSSGVECLLSMPKVLGSILGLVYLMFANHQVLHLQHLTSAVYIAFIHCCKAWTEALHTVRSNYCKFTAKIAGSKSSSNYCCKFTVLRVL